MKKFRGLEVSACQIRVRGPSEFEVCPPFPAHPRQWRRGTPELPPSSREDLNLVMKREGGVPTRRELMDRYEKKNKKHPLPRFERPLPKPHTHFMVGPKPRSICRDLRLAWQQEPRASETHPVVKATSSTSSSSCSSALVTKGLKVWGFNSDLKFCRSWRSVCFRDGLSSLLENGKKGAHA